MYVKATAFNPSPQQSKDHVISNMFVNDLSAPQRVISGDFEGVGTCIAHVSPVHDTRRGCHASASF